MRPLTKISLFGVRLATCVLAVYWTALFTGTHLPSISAITPNFSDKVMHFSGFFGLAFLLCWVIPTRRHPARKFAAVAVIAIAYGAFDEISQGFVRGRTTDIRDFGADVTGVLTAIAVYATLRALFPKYSSTAPLDDADQLDHNDAESYASNPRDRRIAEKLHAVDSARIKSA
jgi:VanZ family protein